MDRTATVRTVLAACLLLVLTNPGLAQAPAATAPGSAPVHDAARPAELTFDRIFGEGSAGREPRGFQWSEDGRRLAFFYDDGEDGGLWVLEPGRGEPRLLVRFVEEPEDPEEASEAAAETREDAEEGPGKVSEYAWSPDGSSLVLLAGGDLWLQPVAGGAARRLTATGDDEEAPAFSPDGGTIAFVRDYDLHVLDVASGEVRALTADGEKNQILNGITDWVYWEEIWGRDSTGFWWSPDSRRIAYYRFEEEPVGLYPLVDFTEVPYPQVEWQRYPKAGTDNPRVRLGVLELGSGETTWLATGEDSTEYLARIDWRPDGSAVAVQRLNRDQTRLDLLLCEPAGGECEVVLEETWPTWINLGDDFRFLADGRFVWGSERSGWRHLYLYGREGELIRPLTAGEWAVTSLDAVDEARGRVVFTSFGPWALGAKDRRVAAVSLAAPPSAETEAQMTVLAGGEGWNTATASAASGLWVHGWSDSETPPRLVVRDATGAEVAVLPTTAPVFDPAALPRYRYFTIAGEGGVRLPARLMEPAVPAAEGEKRPAIMYHYGGPGSQVVANRWDGRGRDLWHKLMAQRGYAVLSVDNPASIFFGKRGEDRVHRRFGPLNLAAQRAGVEHLAGLGWVDPARIGLWGWSGGGMHTLYDLFLSPGTWRAGVSGAPVTDWRLYDTIWTERYLDTPEDNPDGYAHSSPVTHAAGLADRLLIVHGTADDNVHPQNTLALSDLLVKAGKPFEDALYPRQKHGFRTGANRHFYERMTRFFEEALRAEPAGTE
ncbi:MAG TPA: DPP IV N-terminal domain-containing protein [Thermoanaerobaculia bacterium]|nr:DPP IV N-terminal domain-containing protein [Thermoanaerobaculia bacterium]